MTEVIPFSIFRMVENQNCKDPFHLAHPHIVEKGKCQERVCGDRPENDSSPLPTQVMKLGQVTQERLSADRSER